MSDHQRVDAFYTPAAVAARLAAHLPADLSGNVLDPAAGGGALLHAVGDRFSSNVQLLGLDIDRQSVRKLRLEEPGWLLGNADFLSTSSRSSSRPWRTAKTSLSAVVMNPPFSYRGNGGAVIEFRGFKGRVAPAMHFLVEVLRSLRPEAGFYVILPDGALDAERSEQLWREIRGAYEVERLERFQPSSFEGARVSTSLVRIRRLALEADSNFPNAATGGRFDCASAKLKIKHGCRCLEVIRGRVPVHSLDSSAQRGGPVAPFIHTTDLENPVKNRWVADSRLSDLAPLVMLTRVGRWRRPRVIEVGRVVLSDCVFGLRPRSLLRVDDVVNSVDQLESILRSEYRGTGAQYLTLQSLTRVLKESGWNVHVVKAGSAIADCTCERGADEESEARVGVRV